MLHWSSRSPVPNLGSSHTYTFAPSNSNIRYASFGEWTSAGGLYRTTDGGNIWQQVGQGVITATVTALAIHPTNPNFVLAATAGGSMYRSTDGGQNWQKIPDAYFDDSHFFSVAYAPSNPSIAYAGGYLWPYISTDGGATWTKADPSFPQYYIEGLAIHPSQPETVFLGSNQGYNGGVWKRTAATAPFVRKSSGMEDLIVLDLERDPLDDNILYLATWGAGVFRSDTGGSSWTWKGASPYIYALETTQGPTGTILYASTFYSNWGVLKSWNRGDTWYMVSWGYKSDISFDLLSVGGSPTHILAATYEGVQYSTDGGQT